MKKNLVILSGAGMSAESGINTFRDSGGLWEGHDVMKVASPEGFAEDAAMVLEFYNQRRRQLLQVSPNLGHSGLVELEKKFNTSVVTQNVDDLHERAGSSNVIHLHGELRKVRSTKIDSLVYDWDEDCNLGDLCEKGFQLRPHIVWFGEEVPELINGVTAVRDAHYIAIIGTSMQVYPAASLVGYAARDARIFYIDPNPQINHELQIADSLEIIQEKASIGVAILQDILIKESL